MRRSFNYLLFLVTKSGGINPQMDLDLGHPAWVGDHVFDDPGLHSVNCKTLTGYDDGYGGLHATGQGCCQQVGGGEGRALSLVVHRGISNYHLAASRVQGFGT